MMFYKVTPKNLAIDGLVIGLCFFSIYKARVGLEGSIGALEGDTKPAAFYWMVLAAGVFLIRLAYLGGIYFYGENANKNLSLFLKIHKYFTTCVWVVVFVMYLVILFKFVP
jgi:hypothetical protein